MRTTVDLPPDLLARARSLARDQGRSMSAVVTDLVRKGLAGPTSDPRTDGPARPAATRNGFPQVNLGGVITTEDVRRADDE
ncbi:MAG TPA: CopG family transcriptional regulator [Actinomycetes bacterium]